MSEFAFLFIAAFLAGLVDAVGGGGGLLQIPALFSALPATAPATLFGTNKLASIWGTAIAARHYMRRVRLEWNAVVPATIAALMFAFLGAYTVSQLPHDWIRKALPLLLCLMAIYTLRNKDFGLHHRPLLRGRRERISALAAGAAIGFYDGFFGPGTGSLLIFLFVRFFGFDFLGASAAAKVVNVACNAAALLWFGVDSHVFWRLGLGMAACNMLGAAAGAGLATRYGARFVRAIFVLVVFSLVGKTAWQAFFI